MIAKADKPDFVIANGENITDGIDIVERDALKLLSFHINVLTSEPQWIGDQAHKFINDQRNRFGVKRVYGNGYGIYKISDHQS